MYNFSQLLINLKIIFSAIFVFILLNIIMSAITINHPEFLWAPKQYFGVNFVKDNYQRVQGAIAQQKNDKPLVVLIGLSSASEGIETQLLQKKGEDNIQLLSLTGAGRNIKEIDIYTTPLLQSSLTPKLAIFAISPFHLMDPPAKQQGWVDTFNETVCEHCYMGWFSLKRDDIKFLADINIFYLRNYLLNWFDSQVDEMLQSPWRENIRMGLMQLDTEEQWNSNSKRYGERGYYDLKNYKNSNDQIIKLSKLLNSFNDRGTEVAIIMMPEHSSLYNKIPKDALQILLQKLDLQLQGKDDPLILNYRQSIADGGFKDISHMNNKGRGEFTHLLSDFILQKTARLW